MRIRGEDLAARITSMIQVESRRKKERYAAEFGELLHDELQRFGAQSHALEAFDRFRSAKREFSSSRLKGASYPALSKSIESILYPEISSWGTFSLDEVREIFLKFELELDLQVRKLNAANTLRNHLLAVFRPFNEANLIIWARVHNEKNMAEIRRTADELKHQPIGSQGALEDWGKQVWELFYRAAVFRDGHTERTLDPKSREDSPPPGFIGSTTARIYRQRWDDWFEANLEELLRFVVARNAESNIPPELLRPRLREFTDTIASENSGFFRPAKSSASHKTNEAMGSVGNVEQLEGVSITLRSARDELLESSQYWATIEDASNQIESWIKVISAVWNENGQTLSCSLTLNARGNRSSVLLPFGSAEETAQAVNRLLNFYSST